MLVINYEINLILTWSANCFAVAETANNQAPPFAITNTKLYILMVTLSTQDNTKLLQQLKFGFKGTINRNKFQSKVSIEKRKSYLNFEVDQNFQEINRLFLLPFENNAHRKN